MPPTADRTRSPLSLERAQRGDVVARICEGHAWFLEPARNVQAAAADTPASEELARFSFSPLYSGGTFEQWWSPYSLVGDLSGLTLPTRPIPATADHDYRAESTVGHIETAWIQNDQLMADGVLSGESEIAGAIRRSASKGFPWQSSMGASIQSIEEIKPGVAVTVNGREFTGPLWVVRRWTLREGAFVQLGADVNSSTRVAAVAADHSEVHMHPNLTPGATPATTVAAAAAAVPATQPNDVSVEAIAQRAAEAALAAERSRVAQINAACGANATLAQSAIAAGWTLEQTQAELVRASRNNAPAPFAINAGRSSIAPNVQILAAAACMVAGVQEQSLIRAYGQQNVETADRQFRGLRLRDLISIACEMDGIRLPATMGDGSEYMRLSASSVSLPQILESSARRTMLEAYRPHEVAALQLCAVRPVTDFKAVRRVRLMGDGRWEKVKDDGELKHGRLGEQSFDAQADTFGQVVTLTRKDIINDDLGAFLQLFTAMGNAARNSIDFEFIGLLLSTGIISGPNGNLITGAGTVFGLDGLRQLHQAMRKLKAGPGGTKDTTPINVQPRRLFVPPEIEITAAQLLGSEMLVTGANATVGSSNPFRGRYTLHSHPLLSDTAFSSSASATAFYLFTDPAEGVAGFELSVLNGISVPSLMRVDTPAGTLGVSFTGYIDFGVSAQDPRGVGRSAGA